MSHNTRPDASEWPDAERYPKSIRLHFSLYVATIILVMMAVTSIVVSDKYASAVTHGIVERLLAQARSYSGSAGKQFLAADGPDALMLNNICRRLSDESGDIHWAAIADARGKLVAHTDVRLIASVGHLPVWDAAGDTELLRHNEAYAVTGDTVRIRVPIKERNLVLGQLEIAASAEPIARARTQSVVTMASVTLAILLLGLPLTVLLTRQRLKPISVITEHLRKTNLGDLRIDIPIESRNEFGYLADTLRVMGEKVHQAQIQLVEQERMTRELEIARDIQANILPKKFPAAERYESYAFYQSAREVGGDYFDFIELASDRLAFLVADVSGKSLPGMLVMLLTRDIVRQVSRFVSNPAEVLAQVNKELRPNIKRGMFVTMFFGVLDCSTGRFEFCSAGHNPLLYLSAEDNRLHQLRPKGFPLGLMAPEQFDSRIEVGTLDLRPGDILVQYSDGINEAQNPGGEEYGMDRFAAALEKGRTQSSKAIVESVMQAHSRFVDSAPQYDDITLVAVRWRGQTADNTIGEHSAGRNERQHQRA